MQENFTKKRGPDPEKKFIPDQGGKKHRISYLDKQTGSK
jgi:hypothetical protein